MIVPMRVRDRVLGVISFVSAESGSASTPATCGWPRIWRCAPPTAVENARLYRARSTIAQTLQASLLPPMLPEVPGFEAGALYRPAGEDHEVGGDFYDLFATTEDHWFAVIGDVCGKGAEAAAVTALARYTIRAAAAQRRSPAAILRWVNEAMLREGVDAASARSPVAHLDRSARHHAADRRGRRPSRRRSCCAPTAASRSSARRARCSASSTTRGSPTCTTELAPGDTILLYTDGVTEADGPARVWTPQELAAVVETAPGATATELVDHVAEAALAAYRAAPRRRRDAGVAARRQPAVARRASSFGLVLGRVSRPFRVALARRP